MSHCTLRNIGLFRCLVPETFHMCNLPNITVEHDYACMYRKQIEWERQHIWKNTSSLKVGTLLLFLLVSPTLSTVLGTYQMHTLFTHSFYSIFWAKEKWSKNPHRKQRIGVEGWHRKMNHGEWIRMGSEIQCFCISKKWKTIFINMFYIYNFFY